MDESFTFVLPMYPKCLSPNKRPKTRLGHMLYRKAVKRYREGTVAAIASAGITTLPWKRVEVWPRVYFRTKRRRDVDNIVASLKAMYDGIVQAGAVPDDGRETMKRIWPEEKHDPISPRVVVTVVRIE